jgi:glutathione S-transferase
MAAFPKIKLIYFNIEGVAELVRLVFNHHGIPIEDYRVNMTDKEEWNKMKPSTPNGQLPILEIEGQEPITQSKAMALLAARLGGGKLLSTNPWMQAKIDVLLELLGDNVKEFTPALYLGWRAHIYGHPEDYSSSDAGKAKTKELREAYVNETFPRYAKHLDESIKRHGGKYLLGDELTLADFAWYCQLRYLTKGICDHIPATILDNHPGVKQYFAEMNAVPSIAAYYAAKK